MIASVDITYPCHLISRGAVAEIHIPTDRLKQPHPAPGMNCSPKLAKKVRFKMHPQASAEY
jgi:hypothetical protein